MRYLVVAELTDSVVAQGRTVEEAVTAAARLGYDEGYVTNQDGGRGDLWELIVAYGLESVVGETEEDEESEQESV